MGEPHQIATDVAKCSLFKFLSSFIPLNIGCATTICPTTHPVLGNRSSEINQASGIPHNIGHQQIPFVVCMGISIACYLPFVFWFAMPCSLSLPFSFEQWQPLHVILHPLFCVPFGSFFCSRSTEWTAVFYGRKNDLFGSKYVFFCLRRGE